MFIKKITPYFYPLISSLNVLSVNVISISTMHWVAFSVFLLFEKVCVRQGLPVPPMFGKTSKTIYVYCLSEEKMFNSDLTSLVVTCLFRFSVTSPVNFDILAF